MISLLEPASGNFIFSQGWGLGLVEGEVIQRHDCAGARAAETGRPIPQNLLEETEPTRMDRAFMDSGVRSTCTSLLRARENP